MRKLCLLMWVVVAAGAWGQDAKVIMMSDLHFDPLHDPAKAERLAAAPVEGWDAILKEPDSTGQAAAFETLQAACHARGVDSDYAVMTNALQAASTQAKGAAFVTLTGDLLVHSLDCRYDRLLKEKDKAGYAAFAEKTAVYVMGHVEAAFPGVPVYIAGGNNDSACGDYKLAKEDAYLAATSKVALDGLRNHAEAESALRRYKTDGDFSVELPELRKTTLLVLDDIYQSGNSTDCAGKKEQEVASAQLAWLDRQLTGVRNRGEQAWVIGHIPPGVNVYSTLAKGKDVCAAGAVTMFLASDGLAEVIEKHADVVRLGVFAHTHSDEVRVLGGKVPFKLVASVSPVNGNRPTFTVAAVAKDTATLQDFTVYEASNATGMETKWEKEYAFRETYKVKDFSGPSIAEFVGRLQADRSGAESTSQTYETFFTPGMIPLLGFVWPKYACALNNMTEASYRGCACSEKK